MWARSFTYIAPISLKLLKGYRAMGEERPLQDEGSLASDQPEFEFTVLYSEDTRTTS